MMPTQEGNCWIYTKEELIQEGEELARKVLQCGFFDAHQRVIKGELEGTIFASKIQRIHFLLRDYE